MRIVRSPGAAIAFLLAIAALATPPSTRASTVTYWTNSTPGSVTLTSLLGFQQLTVGFNGIASGSPTTVNTPATSALGVLTWQNDGISFGIGSDSGALGVNVNQTVPSSGVGSFASSLVASFNLLGGDTLSVAFANTTINLGGITYQVGYLTNAANLNTFTAFSNNTAFTLSGNAAAGGSRTLYARITGNVTLQAVPEPASLAFLFSGAIPVAVVYGLRRRSALRRPVS